MYFYTWRFYSRFTGVPFVKSYGSASGQIKIGWTKQNGSLTPRTQPHTSKVLIHCSLSLKLCTCTWSATVSGKYWKHRTCRRLLSEHSIKKYPLSSGSSSSRGTTFESMNDSYFMVPGTFCLISLVWAIMASPVSDPSWAVFFRTSETVFPQVNWWIYWSASFHRPQTCTQTASWSVHTLFGLPEPA